jgi:hypothetical protein
VVERRDAPHAGAPAANARAGHRGHQHRPDEHDGNHDPEDYAGTSFERKAVFDAYEEMIVPAGPAWLREHLAQLSANGIQPHFQITMKSGLVTLERLIRRGLYKGR